MEFLLPELEYEIKKENAYWYIDYHKADFCSHTMIFVYKIAQLNVVSADTWDEVTKKVNTICTKIEKGLN